MARVVKIALIVSRAIPFPEGAIILKVGVEPMRSQTVASGFW